MTYDPSDDFEHPRIAEGSPLRPHVLYRIMRAGFEGDGLASRPASGRSERRAADGAAATPSR
jgi:hypothetical protein